MEKLKYKECEKCEDWNGCVQKCFDTCCKPMDAWDEFNKYKQLEEQGLLFQLSCKVGDTVYYPQKDIDYIFPVRISQIIISDLGDGKYCVQYNGCFFDSNNDPYQEFEFDKDDFGKTVFTKQFAAEMKLRELKNN
ncbi:MAG: hypothetical protein IJO85_07405 [Lachnospiraceae bacterium]|nr:hypothetical protein [Lachnospiraceae bacterium]